MDCRYCWENKGCCKDDGWYELDKYIRECDNIIIASPIYFSELTGELLSCVSKVQCFFSARFFRNEEIIEKHKRGGIILVGGGDGKMSTGIKTATGILHHMKAFDIAPAVTSHDTNSVPASQDEVVCESIDRLREFINCSGNRP